MPTDEQVKAIMSDTNHMDSDDARYKIRNLLADREELVEQNLKLRKENQVTLRMYHENKGVDNAIAKYMVQAEADKDELRTRIAELEAGVNNSLLSRVLEALKAVEWSKQENINDVILHRCSYCYGWQSEGHAPDCLPGNAIAEIEKFMVCPTCGGEKVVMGEPFMHQTTWKTCPDCKGTGLAGAKPKGAK